MKSRKILSLIIAVVMAVQLMPVSLSASYTGEETSVLASQYLDEPLRLIIQAVLRMTSEFLL